MNIIKYRADFKNLWNDFIKNSKNGTFMLDRNYMDYHSDRFVDHSLLFFDENGKLLAVMPASLHNNIIVSHGGLTYGGIISDRKMSAQKMLEIFSELKIYMKNSDISKLIYKRVPSIYHTYPSDEDLYALFINDARLVRRDVSSAIDFKNPIKFSERRCRNIKKAKKASLFVKEADDIIEYIDLLNNVLQCRYSINAAHTADELQKLKELFPDNIKLFAAYYEKQMVAGCVIFETYNVAHTQYLANSDAGYDFGALDFVVDYATNIYSTSKQYFDFGISTEQHGKYLNIGLITQKQEFGGRAIVHDFYEIA